MLNNHWPGVENIRIKESIKNLSQWFQRYILFSIVIFTLAVMCWATIILFQQPFSGLVWSYRTGSIISIELNSPAANHFLIGDQILSIDGESTYKARGMPGKLAGDEIIFTILRDGKIYNEKILLEQQHLSNLLLQFSTILVSISFWALGGLILIFSYPNKLVSVFFLFLQVFAIILGVGSISSYGPLWCSQLFNLLIWWVGPLILHTHFLLTGVILPGQIKNKMPFLYTIALLFSFLEVFQLIKIDTIQFQAIKYSWISATLIMAIWVMIYASRPTKSIEFRQKTRLAGLSAFMAFIPFITLSLIPEVLLHRYLIPYEITFLALPILPLGYSYAIFRFKLIHIERYVNRSIVYAFGALVICIIYTVIYFIIPQIIPVTHQIHDSAKLIIAMILILGANPLYQKVQHWIDDVFYGGWYDDRAAAFQISHALAQVRGDAFGIAHSLCFTLQKTLQLEYVNLLLIDGRFVSTEYHPKENFNQLLISENERLIKIFEKLKKIGEGVGAGSILAEKIELSNEERKIIIGNNPQIWILLEGKHCYQGLLVLGMRKGSNEYIPGDLEILEVVLRQAGEALENAFLYNEVNERSKQIKELHYRVIQAREEERKRVSHDLHDKIIQSLIGINYQLTHIRANTENSTATSLLEAQKELRNVLGDIRGVCSDLRPPSLDVLGLVSAIRAKVEEISQQAKFEIFVDVQDPEISDPPESVSISVYRFFQEALTNIQKHAEARFVLVQLISTQELITISIEDDGKGFDLPTNLNHLLKTNHFGLVGLKEQIEAVGGEMIIETSMGAGCQLTAIIPLEECKTDQNLNIT